MLYVYLEVIYKRVQAMARLVLWIISDNLGPKTVLTKTQWLDRMTSLTEFRQDVTSRMLDLLKTVTVHGKYEDAALHRLDGSPCRISTFMSGQGRPLVINFGSCT